MLLPWVSKPGILPSPRPSRLLLASRAPAGLLKPSPPSLLPLLLLARLLMERRTALSRELGEPGADCLARGLLPPSSRALAELKPAVGAALPEVAGRRLQARRALRGETLSPLSLSSSSPSLSLSLSASAGETLEDEPPHSLSPEPRVSAAWCTIVATLLTVDSACGGRCGGGLGRRPRSTKKPASGPASMPASGAATGVPSA